jgi:hypothetical protein
MDEDSGYARHEGHGARTGTDGIGDGSNQRDGPSSPPPLYPPRTRTRREQGSAYTDQRGRLEEDEDEDDEDGRVDRMTMTYTDARFGLLSPGSCPRGCFGRPPLVDHANTARSLARSRARTQSKDAITRRSNASATVPLAPSGYAIGIPRSLQRSSCRRCNAGRALDRIG